METLLLLTYAALCVVIFKVFRIPLNKWTVPTAVLGGIVLIGALLLTMNYNHPYAEVTRDYYATTPIISQIRGRVIEVPVKPNTPLEQGDILFKIDPTPFENAIAGLEARLASTTTEAERAEKLFEQGAGSERERDASRARMEDLKSQLDDARFNLDQTTIVAPTDGYVTQMVLRPGMMALPIAPLMTFVQTSEREIFAWFRQNSLLRLQPGDKAEVTLDAIPGVVFDAKVGYLMPAISEGQFIPGGRLMSYSQEQAPGREAVLLEITDPRFEEYRSSLPSGLFGQAAVYTEHFHHVAIIRKILLRMSAWMNFVYPMH